VKKAVGQFDPGAAGGTNAPWGGVEESLVNPWDYVLTFEGALLFASGAARRMGAGAQGKAAMPFTFDVSPVGFASAADGESAKGELWAPLWNRPASLAEVERLLGEGRAEWNGGHARRGVDAARAATSLGVDRGIDTFIRHAFVERMGQAMLAVPVGRVAVASDRRDDVPALAEIDGWVDRLRRVKNLAAGPARLLRRVDAAVFDLATTPASGPRAQRLQDVLIVLAELDRAVARSTTLRDVVEPLGSPGRRPAGSGWRTPLAAERWWPLLDDGSVELRLARALASGRVPKPEDTAEAAGGSAIPERPAILLRGVQPVPGPTGRWRLAWQPSGRPLVPGLGSDGLVDVLGAFVQRRAADAGRRRDEAPVLSLGELAADLGVDSAAVGGQIGVDPSYPVRDPASLDDVLDFVDAAVDDTRLERLLSALLLLRFGGKVVVPERGGQVRRAIHPAIAVVLPFFHGRPLQVDGLPIRLRAGRDWPRLLAAGRVEEVISDAMRRLRVARLVPLVSYSRALAEGVDGPRVLAAAAFPLSDGGAADLLRRVAVAGRDGSAPLTIDPQEEP
jgi:CRISPR-associated protein Csx17